MQHECARPYFFCYALWDHSSLSSVKHTPIPASYGRSSALNWKNGTRKWADPIRSTKQPSLLRIVPVMTQCTCSTRSGRRSTGPLSGSAPASGISPMSYRSILACSSMHRYSMLKAIDSRSATNWGIKTLPRISRSISIGKSAVNGTIYDPNGIIPFKDLTYRDTKLF